MLFRSQPALVKPSGCTDVQKETHLGHSELLRCPPSQIGTLLGGYRKIVALPVTPRRLRSTGKGVFVWLKVHRNHEDRPPVRWCAVKVPAPAGWTMNKRAGCPILCACPVRFPVGESPGRLALAQTTEKAACQRPGIYVAHFPACFFSSCLLLSLSPCLMTLSVLLNHFSHSSIAFLRAS